MKRYIALIGLVVFFGFSAQTQKLLEGKNYNLISIGFYNLENLYDTIIDPDPNKILQDEFTPNGKNKFTSQRYQTKLENMARVISEMGTDVTPDGLAVIGVCEIENKEVLQDLVRMPALAKRNYQIVHYDSPDKRGVDVALLYQPKYFQYDTSFSYKLTDPGDSSFYTRAQLLVSGTLDGEEFHFMVAHWPSRRGGQKRSEPKRMLAADLAKHMMDSLYTVKPASKFIYMGDLNDDPTSASLKQKLETCGKPEDLKTGGLFNPMEELYLKGIGTLAWRDVWNLFDQMICSENLVESESDFDTYKLLRAKVYNPPYLKQSEGSFKGYPFRTYVGGEWQGGYSDHFPVYLYLVKQLD